MEVNSFSCWWHDRPWIGCRYCDSHTKNQTPRCYTGGCEICGEWPDVAQHAEPPSSTWSVKRVLFWMFVALCALIAAPWIAAIIITVLGAPA